MATRLMRPAGGAATARPVPRTPALLPLPAARPAASAAAAAASCSLLRSRMLARRLQRGLSVSAGAQAGEPPAAAAGADTAAAQEQQPGEYVVVNFYHLVDIERPHQVIAQHREWLEGKEVRGRIYISEQGINAQYGGLRRDAEGYARWLADTQPLFKGLFYTVWPAEGHQYPRLRLKYRPNLISLAGGMQALPITDPSARAIPTQPAEWKRMLTEGVDGRQPLVLDVRNSYEWDAGHFEGAQRPLEDNFHETPTEALPQEIPQYLEGADPDQPVMIYCTGGIRCDVYGTYLRKKGFNNLYTLEGGIQNYMRQEGLDHWNGSLFVFDGRMAIRPNKDREEELEAAAPCHMCSARAALPHANCANQACNRLFLTCPECNAKMGGYCCEECRERPEAVLRGEGRTIRRRRHRVKLRARERAKRAAKEEQRSHARELLTTLRQQADAAADGSDGDGSGGEAAGDAAESSERLQRLRELRQRLSASVPASA